MSSLTVSEILSLLNFFEVYISVKVVRIYFAEK